MLDDSELLRRYAEEHSEEAFAELVRRHINWVHSAALRQVNGDAHFAADVTQLVFTALARKAAALQEHRILAGWLFMSTRFAAAKMIRGERRRQAREQKAELMEEITTDSQRLDWAQVRPVLDAVLAELSSTDREAILLRFFETKSFSEIGLRFEINDHAARMRVERALERLRASLARRGVTSATAAVGSLLAQQVVHAAPQGLATAVTGAAIGAGGAAAGITFMTITKIQVGLAAAAAVAGTAGFVLEARAVAAIRREIAALPSEFQERLALRADNARLTALAIEAKALQADDGPFAQLRDEAAALKRRLEARQPGTAPAAPRTILTELNGQPVVEANKAQKPPRPKSQSSPSYPFELRRAGISGNVLVDFIVDTNGVVRNAWALHSSRPEFEAAAVQAVSSWIFEPGQMGARAVNTHMQVPIVFSLGTSEGVSGEPRVSPANLAPLPNWF